MGPTPIKEFISAVLGTSRSSTQKYLTTHPMVVGYNEFDLDDLSRLVRFEDLPTTVGGAVDVRLVVLALSYQQVRHQGGAEHGRENSAV